MSILDALKVQKANQQSISDLAALPQNQIIRLAQMGQIPADVVPVVISEKARMAKEAANMRAAAQMQQQGGQMPTVIEQAMQANAQAETPQMPPGLPSAMPQAGPGAQAQAPMQMPPQAAPQGMPAEPGVAGLPTGQMFQNQSFQAGGIVAFEDGGSVPGYAGPEGSFVQTPGGLNVLKEELEPKPPGQGPASLAEMVSEINRLNAMQPETPMTPERQAYLDTVKRGTMSKQDVEQQKYMRLLEAGLGIMGGESPYALTNIGKGAQAALKGYGEDVAAQRAAKIADLKASADIADARRAERRSEVAAGSKLYESYLDRELKKDIAKDSQLGAKHAQNYAAMLRKRGDTRNEEELLNAGYQDFFERYGYAANRTAMQGQIAAGAQGATLAGQESNAYMDALKIWEQKSNTTDPEKKQFKNLMNGNKEKGIEKDPAAAEKYKQDWIDKEMARARARGRGTEAAAPAAAPAAPTRPAAAPAQTPVALPKTEAELKNGTVYQTARGPAEWDAAKNQFIPVGR
jgi:hypothetical protein